MKSIISLLMGAFILAHANDLNAQTFLDFRSLTDTTGNVLGTTNGQTFDLGNGCTVTVNWSGVFNNQSLPGDSGSPFANPGTGHIDNQTQDGVPGFNPPGNSITLTFNGLVDIQVQSQRGNAISDLDTGTLTTDGGGWTLTNTGNNNLLITGGALNSPSFDYQGDGRSSMGGGSEFDAFTTGAMSITYAYDPSFRGLTDNFGIFIDNHVVVPEPRVSFMLLGGIMVILHRRKRS